MPLKVPPFKSIAIIGAGPSGLAAAKALLEERFFKNIQIFERQEQAGGVWAYRPKSNKPGEPQATPLVPSVNAYIREPTQLDNSQKKAVYTSPMYKALDTNIPKHLMRYNGYHFDKKLPMFPLHGDVLNYVQSYAKPIEQYIRYNSEVQSVKKNDDGAWQVDYTDYTQNFPAGKSYTKEFDAVVVSTGHYDLPFLPKVKGIEQWNKKFPNSIQHSKYFDDPEDYKDKTVLVVGNSASGFDISMQVALYAKKVYRSIVSESKMPFVADPRVTDVPVIKEYDADNKTIILDKNQEGFDLKSDKLKGVDTVIYCTGYLYNFPFLKSYTDPSNPDAVLLPSGQRVNRLYRQIFYIPDPSLTFVCMSKFIIPFPLAETQGAAIARYYSGRLQLPSESEMRADEIEREKAKGSGSEYHNLPFPEDVEYYRSLQDWIKRETKDSDTLKQDEGFQPEEWTDERFEDRKNAFELKINEVKKKIEAALKKD